MNDRMLEQQLRRQAAHIDEECPAGVRQRVRRRLAAAPRAGEPNPYRAPLLAAACVLAVAVAIGVFMAPERRAQPPAVPAFSPDRLLAGHEAELRDEMAHIEADLATLGRRIANAGNG